MELIQLFQIADLALYALERGLIAQDRIAEIRERMADMVKEGRNPTAEEWADLRDRLNLSDAIIEERAAAARAAMG